jgi:hypothetical protein
MPADGRKKVYRQREVVAYPLFRECFQKLEAALLGLASIRLYDVHDQATCGSLMPDYVGSDPRLASVKEFYHELLGESKDLEKLKSTNLRQLETYALSVFGCQPLRRALYAFLATCEQVIFVRFERPASGSLERPALTRPFLPFTRTPAMVWQEGVFVLASLLLMTKEARGTVQEIPRPVFPEPYSQVEVDGYLRRGRTAVVYRAFLPTSGRVVALKVYHKEWHSAMENEYACLQLLKDTPSVLRVVAFSRQQFMMMLAPVAVSLSQLYATVELIPKDACTYCSCVSRLNRMQSSWGRSLSRRWSTFTSFASCTVTYQRLIFMLSVLNVPGCVHCDPCCDSSEPQVVLVNDFGFAVEANLSGSFCGTIRYAPTSTLQTLAADPSALIEAQCWHDLESAVKLTMSLALTSAMPPPAATVEESLTHWTEVEQHMLVSPGLQKLLLSARSCNYAMLISQLQELLA